MSFINVPGQGKAYKARGNFGHAGRPGERGGSAPSSGEDSSTTPSGMGRHFDQARLEHITGKQEEHRTKADDLRHVAQSWHEHADDTRTNRDPGSAAMDRTGDKFFAQAELHQTAADHYAAAEAHISAGRDAKGAASLTRARAADSAATAGAKHLPRDRGVYQE